jgi:hypothetical protein
MPPELPINKVGNLLEYIWILVPFLVLFFIACLFLPTPLTQRHVNFKYMGEVFINNSDTKPNIFEPIIDGASYYEFERLYNIELPNIDFSKNQYLYISFERKLLDIKYDWMEKFTDSRTDLEVMLGSEYQPGKIYIYMSDYEFQYDGGSEIWAKIKGSKGFYSEIY